MIWVRNLPQKKGISSTTLLSLYHQSEVKKLEMVQTKQVNKYVDQTTEESIMILTKLSKVSWSSALTVMPIW